MKHHHEIYRTTRFPVFQNRMFASKQLAKDCAKGDIVLVQDLDTGLIFNQAFRPELMDYSIDYQNEQAVSPMFQEHLTDICRIIKRHFGGCSLVEIGCGKGHFLETLQSLGFGVTGIDPTYDGTNPSVIKDFFTPALGLKSDGIILRHVLEHVRDPFGFLASIRASNGGAGTIYIEVPCFDWICAHRAWFDVYYEHVNYFRLVDMLRLFGNVHEAGYTFQGQYLYIVADLASIKIPQRDLADKAQLPPDFLGTVEHFATKLRTRSLEGGTRARAAVWGGASKGVIFSLFMQRSGAAIDLVIDINPAKQGKYLAGTGLQVWSPEAAIQRLVPGADIFVMNSNYLNEIQNMTDNRFSYVLVENERH